jgi:hypothetical protein
MMSSTITRKITQLRASEAANKLRTKVCRQIACGGPPA